MKLGELFLNALYPDGVACMLCGRDGPLDGHGLCRRCAALLCRAGNFSLAGTAGACAGLSYNDAAAGLVRRFKYHDGRYLGRRLAEFISLPDWSADAMLPVPLHPLRERERGYNQSLILARELGERYGIPVRTDLLRRVRSTPAQAGTGRAQRRANLKGAFKASGKCRGLSLILIDDVITTGSTMEECALALTSAGAKKVYAAALCYAAAHSGTAEIK